MIDFRLSYLWNNCRLRRPTSHRERREMTELHHHLVRERDEETEKSAPVVLSNERRMFNSQRFFHQLRQHNELVNDQTGIHPSKYSSYSVRRGLNRLDDVHPYSSIISSEMINDLSSSLLKEHLSLVADQWIKCQERLMKRIGNIQSDFERHSEISLKKSQRQCQTKLFQWLAKNRSKREQSK